MSGINTTVGGAVTTPAPQNFSNRAPARADAQPAAESVIAKAVATTKPAEKPQADTESKLREKLKVIADSFGKNTDLVIRVDAESKRYIYEFRDAESGEVIRQYPQADLAALLRDKKVTDTGLFVSAKV
jgi:uncharacterized FlaG/YvyC family protein